MFMLATRNGIVTFESKGEYDVWIKTGMNRFSVLGELEEIDILEPAPYAFTVYAAMDNDGEINFFEDMDEAMEKADEWGTEVYTYVKEV